MRLKTEELGGKQQQSYECLCLCVQRQPERNKVLWVKSSPGLWNRCFSVCGGSMCDNFLLLSQLALLLTGANPAESPARAKSPLRGMKLDPGRVAWKKSHQCRAALPSPYRSIPVYHSPTNPPSFYWTQPGAAAATARTQQMSSDCSLAPPAAL